MQVSMNAFNTICDLSRYRNISYCGLDHRTPMIYGVTCNELKQFRSLISEANRGSTRMEVIYPAHLTVQYMQIEQYENYEHYYTHIHDSKPIACM